MPVCFSKSVNKTLINRKDNVISKFYIYKAENEDNFERKLQNLNLALMNCKNVFIYLEILSLRVAIYEKLKIYSHCIENLKWIKKIDSGINVDCLINTYSSKKKKPKAFFRMKRRNVYKHLPDISRSIKLSDDKLIARKSIKAGELIAIEELFCGIISENGKEKSLRCTNCLKSNELNLISCLNCCTAMFCSTHCYKTAIFHHKYECCDALKTQPIPEHLAVIQIALRNCCAILHHCNDSVKKMIKFVEKSRNNPTSIFKLKYSKPKSIQLHAAMLSLKKFSNQQKDTQVIENIIKMYPKIDHLFKKKSHRKFLIDFIIQQSSIEVIAHIDNSDKQQLSALSVQFLYNLMEHSCASNIACILKNNKMYYFAKYPINRGEMLTNDHSINFEMQSSEERCKKLKLCYGIEKCICQACTLNFPAYDQLKIVDDQLFAKTEMTINNILQLNIKEAKSLLRQNRKYLDENIVEIFPSKNLSLISQLNTLLYAKFL